MNNRPMTNFKNFIVCENFHIKIKELKGRAQSAFSIKAANPYHSFGGYIPAFHDEKIIGAFDGKEYTIVQSECMYSLEKALQYNSIMRDFARNSNLCVFLFSVKNRESFDNILGWSDFIKTLTSQDCKTLLIGITDDCIVDNQLFTQRIVNPLEAKKLANKIGASDYRECSLDKPQEVQAIVQRMLVRLFNKKVLPAPEFFQKNFVEGPQLNHYVKNSIELAKGRRQKDNVLNQFCEEIIENMIIKMGEGLADEEDLKIFSDFVRENIPRYGIRLFNYKNLNLKTPLNSEKTEVEEKKSESKRCSIM